jgi:hypothetical protein
MPNNFTSEAFLQFFASIIKRIRGATVFQSGTIYEENHHTGSRALSDGLSRIFRNLLPLKLSFATFAVTWKNRAIIQALHNKPTQIGNYKPNNKNKAWQH